MFDLTTSKGYTTAQDAQPASPPAVSIEAVEGPRWALRSASQVSSEKSDTAPEMLSIIVGRCCGSRESDRPLNSAIVYL
jgi:hypothetical protein